MAFRRSVGLVARPAALPLFTPFSSPLRTATATAVAPFVAPPRSLSSSSSSSLASSSCSSLPVFRASLSVCSSAMRGFARQARGDDDASLSDSDSAHTIAGRPKLRCVAYCTSNVYKLKSIEKLFANPTKLSKKVAPHYRHFTHPLPQLNPRAEVFFFPIGTFVAWNVSAEEEKLLLDQLPSSEASNTVTTTTLATEAIREDYQWQSTGTTTRIEQDVITLAAQEDTFETKLAVSLALSASVRTSVIEAQSEHILDKVLTQVKTEEANEDGMVGMITSRKRRAEQKKSLSNYRNVLLGLRNTQLALSGDHDYFWDYAGGHEALYRTVKNYLDVRNRVRVVGEASDHALGLIQSLMDDSKHAHSIRLELIIIALIAVEVVFNVLDHWELTCHLVMYVPRLIAPQVFGALPAQAPPPPPRHGKKPE